MSMIEHKRLTVRNCHEESISIETLVVENCKWWHALFAIDFQKHSIPESVYLGKDLHLWLNKVLNPTTSSQFCRVINEKIHVRFMWINKIVLIVILADLHNHHHNQNPSKSQWEDACQISVGNKGGWDRDPEIIQVLKQDYTDFFSFLIDLQLCWNDQKIFLKVQNEKRT